MREYHVEIGAQDDGGAFLRQFDEPVLARTTVEAVLVASEIIKRRRASPAKLLALLYDEKTRLVWAWRPESLDTVKTESHMSEMRPVRGNPQF